jgi:hypothetical protein
MDSGDGDGIYGMAVEADGSCQIVVSGGGSCGCGWLLADMVVVDGRCRWQFWVDGDGNLV